MDAQFVAIVERLVREQGKAVMLDAAKCKFLLNDYAKNEYKKGRHLLLIAVEVGVAKEIANAADVAIAKKVQIRTLKDDHFIDEAAAAGVVDLLGLVLRGDRSVSAGGRGVQTPSYTPPTQSYTPPPAPSAQSYVQPPQYQQQTYNNSSHSQSGAFIDPTVLTNWVRWFLYLYITITVISIFSDLSERQLLNDFQRGVYTTEASIVAAAEANDARQGVIGLIYLGIWLVLGVLVLKWIYRANFNARQLGASNMKFTPGWSVGWYFIPIACLWKPYQAMREIWCASSNPQNWQKQDVSSLLGWWWFLWVVSAVLGTILFRMTMNAEELYELLATNTLGLFAGVVEIPLTLVMLAIVNRIYAMQMSHYKHP
ncbi:hypothetical protein FACS189487_06900 [Campylobacterota bacterium]|nr:hypothetical protein FACS189487_06900 [Campylobacterota bacterium]